jgi:branched-chain amino acid transport system permease protein
LFNTVVLGLLQGGIFALISMGLSMQYGVAKILNVSHGEFLLYGALMTWSLVTAGVHPVIALILCIPVLFAAGFVVHRTIYEKGKSVSKSFEIFQSNAMLIAFGSMFILQNVATRVWGSTPLWYEFLAFSVTIGPSPFIVNRIFAFILALVMAAVFYLFLYKTRIGKSIRAAAQDPGSAEIMGVKIKTIMAVCFGVGAAMAGIAGSLISMYTSLFTTTMGMANTLIAIIVVVLGGLGSIPGSLIGGFILGLVGAFVTSYIDPALSVAAFYAIIMVMLLVRPKGLLGR